MTIAIRRSVTSAQRNGFTLIELSIVLVIIGLIVGGVLVGQDMVAAAGLRATIAQIEKYNTAANTFVSKFGGVPGDLLTTQASQAGLNTTGCTGTQGSRDGNGLLDGLPDLYSQTEGETSMFWQDLSAAGLIGNAIPNGSGAVTCSGLHVLSQTQVPQYFPAAKLGQGNFFYTYEIGGSNWFGLIGIVASDTSGSLVGANTNLTVLQAYNLDAKIDDGIPNTGNVVAKAAMSAALIGTVQQFVNDSATSCYHDHSGASYGYSTSFNNGSGLNCGLSFKMQGAAR